MDIEGAVYAHLAADAGLTSLISAYRGQPAIFTVSPVPDDAELPYVVINPVSDVPADTLAEEHRVAVLDVAVYVRNTGSTAVVKALAERVRDRLHHVRVPLAGWDNYLTTCLNVLVAPTDRTVLGRVVSFRFALQTIA